MTSDSTPTLGRIAQAGLLVGPLLSMIDSSIVNVAVPDIADELTAKLDDVQWIVSGYLLALGVALALTAYLAKRFGVMRIYTVSMILFVAASAVCAVAPDVGTLIAARAVQGFVGAPLVPLAISILLGKPGSGEARCRSLPRSSCFSHRHWVRPWAVCSSVPGDGAGSSW